MLEFMGSMGMTTYYYAPKDDPYHREKWREPYPADRMTQFRELLAVSRKYKIDIYFALSPGLTMVYSDPNDLQALTMKLDAMAALGFAHFALFFDDVPPLLTNARDQARFGSLAAAHAT
jgi:hyaluronoglucosaminidase